MDWHKDTIKQMILICDSPEHGKEYLNMPDYEDRYPEGTPNNFTVPQLMHEMAERQINFCVCRLDCVCDKMILKMHEHFKKRVEGKQDPKKHNCCIKDHS